MRRLLLLYKNRDFIRTTIAKKYNSKIAFESSQQLMYTISMPWSLALETAINMAIDVVAPEMSIIDRTETILELKSLGKRWDKSRQDPDVRLLEQKISCKISAQRLKDIISNVLFVHLKDEKPLAFYADLARTIENANDANDLQFILYEYLRSYLSDYIIGDRDKAITTVFNDIFNICRGKISEQESELIEYQQDEETYIGRKTDTKQRQCRFIDLIKFDDPDVQSLLSVLAEAEHICAIDNYRSNNKITVSSDDDRVTVDINMDSDKSVFDNLLKLQLGRYKFTGTNALDEGGVSRQVFTMAGRHIMSHLSLRGGRYYFNGRKKGSGSAIAHIIRLSIINKRLVGVPLSYGILYCIREGKIPSLDNITLPELIYLYWKDNNHCTASLKTMLDPYYWDNLDIADEIQEATQVMGFILKKTLNRTDRLEWMRRFLFGLLFGTLHSGKLMHNVELDNFLSPVVWDIKSQMSIRNTSLDNISDIIGIHVSGESVYSTIKYIGVPDEMQTFIKKFILEADEAVLKSFLIFVAGAVDLKGEISITATERHKLPISHTCSRLLEFNRIYRTYDALKADLDIALTEEGFSFI